MLPDDVRKAVERLDNAVMFKAPNADYDAYLLIRAHLLAREAEVERANDLLSDALGFICDHFDDERDMRARIIAHLKEQPHG